MITPIEREERIRSWLLTTVNLNGIERFHDLHVDRIDPEWKERHQWLNAGLTALRIAVNQRTQQQLSVDVALVYSLKAATDPVGINFSDTASLQGEFDWSPPSLYLLQKGEKPWAHGSENRSPKNLEVVTKPIDPHLFGNADFFAESYFMEFKAADTIEYSRTIHLIG